MSERKYFYKDFRLYLLQVLNERKKKNPRYLLRSFASQLGMSPSALSAMLKGKKSFVYQAEPYSHATSIELNKNRMPKGGDFSFESLKPAKEGKAYAFLKVKKPSLIFGVAKGALYSSSSEQKLLRSPSC